MNLTPTYDVFISYHGSYAQDGSYACAEGIYDFLTEQGLKCFFFPRSTRDTYKANVIASMRSCVFLLVCTNGINTLPDGRIDRNEHYELSMEIDAFYALAQLGEVSVADAKVVVCGDYRKGDESRLHELFANRTHFYFEDETSDLEPLYEWIAGRVIRQKHWHETQVTSEIQQVFAARSSMAQTLHFDDLIAAATKVRVAGISNSEMASRISPGAVTNCVNHGGTIEMLFLDPDGQFTPLREQEEGHRKNRIRNLTYSNIDYAIDFRERVQEKADAIKLFTYDKQPRMNMIFVDGQLILQYYANKIAGQDSPTFYLQKKANSPIYDFCEKAYDYLRQDAVEIEV